MAEFQIWLADMSSSTERFLGSTSDATTLTYTIPNVARLGKSVLKCTSHPRFVENCSPSNQKRGARQRKVGRIFLVFFCMEVCFYRPFLDRWVGIRVVFPGNSMGFPFVTPRLASDTFSSDFFRTPLELDDWIPG